MVGGADMIGSYTDLQAAVIEYLAREQDAILTARVPTFIQLAEAKFNRELLVRQMERRSTTIMGDGEDEPEFVSLPDGFQSMRRIRLSSVTGKPHLEYMATAALDEFRCARADTPGRPQYFAIYGNEIEIAPTPDGPYTVEMVFRQNVPPLAANASNWLLTLAPDLYLYGALLESAPYIKEDARIQTWGLGVSTALDGLNRLSLASTFNAGPLVMRVSGSTP
ncbi:MAG: hypothetical protein JWP25_8226 [Bradyrhizobium sp.]|nr:hypothetical protein [Bradyrhizobium sp.]